MNGNKSGLGRNVTEQLAQVPHHRLVKRKPRRLVALLAVGGLLAGGAAYKFWPRQSAAPVAAFTESASTDSAAVREAEVAPLARCIAQLDKAEEILSKITDIRAVFHKQERIEGVLGDLNRVDLKVRHKPLSAYMRWISKPEGREILWQEDANDGKILVQAGGMMKNVLPVLRVDPNGGQAMSASRHPISEIGPWHMTEELNRKIHTLQDHPAMTATVSEVRGEGDRPILKYSFSQPAPRGELTCHKLVIYIDEAMQIPLGYEVFDFPPAGSTEPALDESYLYTKLELNPGLTQIDFDESNPAYEFKRK